MRSLLVGVASVLVPAAMVLAPANAAVGVSSGDTCTATGTGTSYTLVINLPATALEQNRFAFGAVGSKVMNINVDGNAGMLSTTALPAGTSGLKDLRIIENGHV